jgi:hypothetical protein
MSRWRWTPPAGLVALALVAALAPASAQAAAPALHVPDVPAIEPESGPEEVVVTAWLEEPSAVPIEVGYYTRPETAEDGDYDETSGRLVFAPGQTVAQLGVVVYPDATEYEDERIAVNLTMPAGLEGRSHSIIHLFDRDVEDDKLCNRLYCLRPGWGPLRAHSSGASSELRKTIPIQRRGRGRVVMRIGPRELRGFGEGDSIEASAEVEVSTTCVERSRRCIGSRYRYSPKVKGKIVLGPGESSPRGAKVARSERLVCSQERPNRNHHCVLVFEGERRAAPSACPDCHLKLVLKASHRKAGRGDKLVIGADGTRGIQQGKGRLNAIVYGPGAPPGDVTRDRRPATRSIPVASRAGGNNPRRIVYSARLDGLQRWEQIAVDAKTKIRTGHLPYGTFVGSHLVLSRLRGAPHLGQVEGDTATYGGEFSEKNGFNCTRGRSAHRSPCTIRKVGVVRMMKTANRPLWVHLVVEASAVFGGRWHAGDAARILRGELRVRRYPAGGWVSVIPRW